MSQAVFQPRFLSPVSVARSCAVRSCAVVACVGVLGWAAAALACGAQPNPDVAITGAWPADGETGVPIDAALVVELAPPPWLGAPWIDVSVTRASDASPIAGTVEVFGDLVRFLPDAPLSPMTEHSVVVTLAEGYAFDASAGGVERLEQRFTTGKASLDALDADDPEYRFELYDAPVADCSGQKLVGQTAAAELAGTNGDGCPSPFVGCVAAGTEVMPRAHVELGPIAGGQEKDGYTVMVWLTDRLPYYDEPGDDTSHDVVLGAMQVVAAGESLAVDLELPEEDADYTACVTVTIQDASGKTLRPEPFCTARSEAFLGRADAGGGGDGGGGAGGGGASIAPPQAGDDGVAGGAAGGSATAGAGADDARAGGDDVAAAPRGDGGCRAAGAGTPGAALGWMALALVLARSRRRWR